MSLNGPNSTAPSEDSKKHVYVLRTDETCAESVIKAVSRLAGEDAEAMDPLFDVVDPDALNTLCDGDPSDERAPRRVSFRFNGCDVVVYGDGRTVVSRATNR